MVGYVSEAVASALKNDTYLRSINVIPVRATDGSAVVVNTALPAIAINIIGTDGEGGVFIGGGIRIYFELSLYCLIKISNFTFSTKIDKQTEMLDISDKVIKCIESSDKLNEVKQTYDLSLQFERLETDTTYGTSGSLQETVDVHKVVYSGSVDMQKITDAIKYEKLIRVEVDNNGINETIIE